MFLFFFVFFFFSSINIVQRLILCTKGNIENFLSTTRCSSSYGCFSTFLLPTKFLISRSPYLSPLNIKRLSNYCVYRKSWKITWKLRFEFTSGCVILCRIRCCTGGRQKQIPPIRWTRIFCISVKSFSFFLLESHYPLRLNFDLKLVSVVW